MSDHKKIAVVLFNLGGPDSRESIRPFLMNFFLDKNIIRVPQPFRYLIASGIANRRSRKEARDSYEMLGGRSPLLDNSQAQGQALEKVLNAEDVARTYKVFVCMRYWHPMAKDVAARVKAFGADKIILLPLYPQFSTTTTRSSLQQWNKAARAAGLATDTAMICCYPREEGFIEASARLTRDIYKQCERAAQKKHLGAPRILFSAHGLPESVINDGDPYQWQCVETAKAIIGRTGIEKPDWVMCYQSRVGPKKWLGPSTEDEILRAAREKVPVVIYPHSFTQEHVETLAEIEVEYRELAHREGVPLFYRVPTVSTDELYINGLAGMAEKALASHSICSNTGARICPAAMRRCCMQEGRLAGMKKGAG